MTVKIGNAPCSWGTEFPSDPAYPTWQSVSDQCAGAGFAGIELGPIRFVPEDGGLTVGVHAQAMGFMDFEPELERLLGEVDEST